jgi:3-phosphoshikimate 1-carboxyvinyltransferase
MKEFGAKAENKNYEFFKVKAGQSYKAKKYFVEGDYSNAAYFFAAAAICEGKVKVSGLRLDSKQGDAFFVEALKKMGCKIKKQKDSIELQGNKLKALGKIDMNNFPDIVMPLAVVAAFAEGKTELANIAHLRIKESDRIAATVEELKKIGADATATPDSIIVNGDSGKCLHGALTDSHNDHRIAMSLASAGLKVRGIKIENEKAVEKSFPNFFEEIEKIVQR